MATISKKKIIQQISRQQQLHPNDVRQVIQAFLDTVTTYLSMGNRLEFRDFGVFEVVECKQKVGRNPRKADIPLIIPPHPKVKFSAGRRMRRLVEAEWGQRGNATV